MATLLDIRTKVASAIRDASYQTFSSGEVDDMINQGIDALAEFYPREIVQTVGTVSASVYTYDVSAFQNFYRVDLYTAGGVYRATIPHGYGDGPNSGWESHGGILYLPPGWTLTAGDTLKVFGYGRYTQLSVSTSTTDLDTSGIFAVVVYAQAEAYSRLGTDRAKYQQWQTQSNGTDVSLVQVANAEYGLRQRWQAESQRLRKLRKTG